MDAAEKSLGVGSLRSCPGPAHKKQEWQSLETQRSYAANNETPLFETVLNT